MLDFRHCFTIAAMLALAVPAATLAQRSPNDDDDPLSGMFHVGLEFGEIPFHGSFKPGISIGYHVNSLLYFGLVYQLPDSIERDGTSFNAKAIGLEGLTDSRETVGQRAYLQARVRPHRYSPYLSLGLVFNDRDTETIRFDDRQRTVGGQSMSGPITIVQSRPGGLRPALGLGYSYTFDTGLELFTEWSGWWLFGAPEPELSFDAPDMPEESRAHLSRRISGEFTSSPFNTYHVFQLGAGYTF